MKYFFIWSLSVLAVFMLMISPIIIHHIHAFLKDVMNVFRIPGTGFDGKRRQAGFVTLLRPYGGYQAGQVVELPASTEATLIAAGGATVSAGPATSGALSTFQNQGAGTFAATTSSVTITHPSITIQSIVFAALNQSTADTTLLRIERIVAAAGSVTIFGNAAATAPVGFDWAIIASTGTFSSPN